MICCYHQVELHVHLDGAVRPETAWELAKLKNLDLPGRGTLEDFKVAISIDKPIDLQHFLKSFAIFTPSFV
jgi:adenosine deaminase